MSKAVDTRTEEEREALVKTTPYDYSEMKVDALALYMKGYGSRHARRILYQKYKDNVVASNTIRAWFRKYGDEIKDAVGRSREMDVLAALEAEDDWAEDVSDDILSFALPSLMKDLKANKFDELPIKDKWDAVTKEINAKSQRNERKILRLDSRSGPDIPQFVILAMRQSSEAPKAGQPTEKELNGSSDSRNPAIIDAEFEQVADIPATRLQPSPGDTD
jgi:hypothetical protein